MNWIELTSAEQLAGIKELKGYSLLFKHSTRCSISLIVKKTLEREWEQAADTVNLYYLDLLNFRPISAQIAANYDIRHESPQALLIKDGQCVYHASHDNISAEDILKQIGS